MDRGCYRSVTSQLVADWRRVGGGVSAFEQKNPWRPGEVKQSPEREDKEETVKVIKWTVSPQPQHLLDYIWNEKPPEDTRSHRSGLILNLRKSHAAFI